MLIAHNIHIKFDGENLFKDLTISLDSASGKRVALVGYNGAGKSTLLKILAKEIKPTAGTVTSADEHVGYLPQQISFSNYEFVGEFLEDKIENIWEEYKIEKALRDVGLSVDYIYKYVKDLSGGEKVKVALAGLLMEEPTILLFDEPTNNLDIQGIEWLITFIQQFRGSVLIVSHDRTLINSIADVIWEIDPNTLGIHVYGGNYDSFLKEKERDYQIMVQDFNRVNREIKRIEQWLRANEFHPKYQFSSFVMSQKRKLTHLKAQQLDKPIADPQLSIRDLSNVKRGLVLKVDILDKSFGKKTILANVAFKVYKQEKVLIRGANGSGKSTLLKIISGEDSHFDGFVEMCEGIRLGYLKQESSLDQRKTILHEFERITGIGSPRSRSILAHYGFGVDMVQQSISILSYGQLKRLDLAIILSQEPDLLILDEPTNHLDLYTREEFESFLTKQRIPMIIVSHDTYFIQKIQVDKVVELNS